MATPFAVGTIRDPRTDPYPSSGAHLDLRIKGPDGNWVNPAFARSIIGRNVGIDGKPLYVQKNGDWVINPEVGASKTSGFGSRDTGIPGASKWHPAHDYAGGKIKAGAQVSWLGGGRYIPTGDSKGTIFTTDPNTGKQYEVSMLHIAPNQQGFNSPQTPQGTPATPPQQPAATNGSNNPMVINIVLADLLKQYDQQQQPKKQDLFESLLGTVTDNLVSTVFAGTGLEGFAKSVVSG